MAAKRKNMLERWTFLGGRGQGSEGHDHDIVVKFRS